MLFTALEEYRFPSGAGWKSDHEVKIDWKAEA